MLSVYISIVETEREKDRITYLYEKFMPLMMNCALRFTRSAHEAEDAVHNAWLYMIQNKEKYLSMNEASFYGSCVLLVRDKCIDAKRRKKRENISLEEVEPFLVSDDEPLDIIFEKFEQIRNLKGAIGKLGADEKLLLEMKYAGGMSYTEITEQTGFDSVKIDHTLRNARKKMRLFLEGE
jgi:RNA polymerase sigma-70 factor (ECF subfamily)